MFTCFLFVSPSRMEVPRAEDVVWFIAVPRTQNSAEHKQALQKPWCMYVFTMSIPLPVVLGTGILCSPCEKMSKGPNVRCSEVATLSYLPCRACWRKILLEILNFLFTKKVRWWEEDVDLGARERLEWQEHDCRRHCDYQAVGQRKVVLLDIRRVRTGDGDELKWDEVSVFCSWKLPTETGQQRSLMSHADPRSVLVVVSCTWTLFSSIPRPSGVLPSLFF